MLELMPITLILAYIAFSTFAFYQQLHLKNFRGASQGFGLVLNLSAFAAMMTGFVFLVYYGWTVRWYLPILLFAISLIVQLIWFAIEVSLRIRDLPFILSLLGFIIWPAAAVVMFRALPEGS